jgi:hypothetical protein
MTGDHVLHIDMLVIPGVDAHGAEQVVQALYSQLGVLAAADQAQGLTWRQPDQPIDLSIDCGADGAIDTEAMASAIRAQFVQQGHRP